MYNQRDFSPIQINHTYGGATFNARELLDSCQSVGLGFITREYRQRKSAIWRESRYLRRLHRSSSIEFGDRPQTESDLQKSSPGFWNIPPHPFPDR